MRIIWNSQWWLSIIIFFLFSPKLSSSPKHAKELVAILNKKLFKLESRAACLFPSFYILYVCDCLSAWPDLAKFCHFVNKLKVFGQIFGWFILYLANFCAHFGIFYASGQIVIVVNGRTSNNNIAVWSHCFQFLLTFLSTKNQ